MSKVTTNPVGGFGPLTPAKVAEMGLTVEERVCTVQHRPGMKPHRHIGLPTAAPESAHLAHACPTCGDVHLWPSEAGVQ